MLTTRRLWLPLTAAALVLAAMPAGAAEARFGASLNGASELPEPRDTKATGELELTLSPDGRKLTYTLTVSGILNAASADLHIGPATANGPLIVKLFPTGGAAPKKGEFSGVLAQGTIEASDLSGPLTGSPLSELIDLMREGSAYTNVHTSDGMDPPNSGPGDYRLGEIRGQIAEKLN